jgi:hypothetical protein
MSESRLAEVIPLERPPVRQTVPLTGYSVLASTRGGWLFLVWARR